MVKILISFFLLLLFILQLFLLKRIMYVFNLRTGFTRILVSFYSMSYCLSVYVNKTWNEENWGTLCSGQFPTTTATPYCQKLHQKNKIARCTLFLCCQIKQTVKQVISPPLPPQPPILCRTLIHRAIHRFFLLLQLGKKLVEQECNRLV